MLGLLVKKQISEVFKGYFFDAKKNRMRSKAGIVGMFILFFAVMVLLLGGMFTGMALSLCESMTEAGIGWMYFMIMGGIAILLGAFGSIFNTYSGLYLSKDNDLLLSMPVPVRDIVGARVINVYLMGTMYSVVVMIPTLVIYWVKTGATPLTVICGLMLALIVTVIVLILSCSLGWVIARISLKLKYKSFVSVFVSLAFIAGYYFFYFKANDLIRDMINNSEVYGTRVKTSAYPLYMFGSVGEGNILNTVILTVIMAVLTAGVWIILLRSFVSIVTASGRTEKVRYVQKEVKEKNLFAALLAKELGRFTASSGYMLNCGLGIFLLPACAVLWLIKGRDIQNVIEDVFAQRPGLIAVLICVMLCFVASMNDMAAASVSLEGKSIWILQSMPVSPRTVLRAKACVQLLLTGIPMLLAVICCIITTAVSPAVKLLMVLMPLSYVAYSALMNIFLGTRMAILNWTSELAPIKQSGAVTIALFGGWGINTVFVVLYLVIGYKLGAAAYLGIWTILFAVVVTVLYRWMNRKGVQMFAEL